MSRRGGRPLISAGLGPALVDWATRAAVAEARFLALLAEFDRREGWYLDGQLSAVDWLEWRCGMSRRTARDKPRVAHELGRRPVVREAFEEGSLSYSQVRAITRVEGANEETDGWLLKLADRGTVADLERAVHHYQSLADQERGVDDYLARYDRRSITASRTYDGMVVLEVVLPAEEGEEVLASLSTGGSAEPGSSPGQARADRLMELMRGDQPAGHRYTVNMVADVGAIDDSHLATETLRRIACDCGIVRHLVRGRSEPLDIGRRTSVWTTAQRRAIAVRDGGIRFLNCHRRTCDVHHVSHDDDGGPTAVGNGILLCPRHHTAVHEGGFTITGEANGTLTFHRPDGSQYNLTEPGGCVQKEGRTSCEICAGG